MYVSNCKCTVDISFNRFPILDPVEIVVFRHTELMLIVSIEGYMGYKRTTSHYDGAIKVYMYP